MQSLHCKLNALLFLLSIAASDCRSLAYDYHPLFILEIHFLTTTTSASTKAMTNFEEIKEAAHFVASQIRSKVNMWFGLKSF